MANGPFTVDIDFGAIKERSRKRKASMKLGEVLTEVGETTDDPNFRRLVSAIGPALTSGDALIEDVAPLLTSLTSGPQQIPPEIAQFLQEFGGQFGGARPAPEVPSGPEAATGRREPPLPSEEARGGARMIPKIAFGPGGTSVTLDPFIPEVERARAEAKETPSQKAAREEETRGKKARRVKDRAELEANIQKAGPFILGRGGKKQQRKNVAILVELLRDKPVSAVTRELTTRVRTKQISQKTAALIFDRLFDTESE